MIETITLIAIGVGIVLCIYLSGTFSASEMSYSSCNEVRMENEAEDGNKRAKRVLKIIENFDDSLSTILIGNNLVNIASSSLASVFIIILAGTDELTYIGTIVMTVLVIIFGETIPKILAKKNANRYALRYSGFITVLSIILWPLVKAVVALTHLIAKLVKEAPKEEDEEETVQELHSIIDTAEDEGVLDADQKELVQAAIDFDDIAAFEVMTARVDIDAINIEDSVEDILEQVKDSPYSRLPVYEDSIDNIIGTLHVNHLLKALTSAKNADIRAILMPPCFVYKTMKLPKVLNILKAAKQHLAIVTDEYSGTLGVISMEDVLEQIVGDIWDETDEVEPEVIQAKPDFFEVDGDMIIEDFLELTELNREEFDYESDTVGGWTIEMLEKFPEAGDAFEYEDFRISVEETEGRRVTKVSAKKLKAEEP